jgi:hypothetical protein
MFNVPTDFLLISCWLPSMKNPEVVPGYTYFDHAGLLPCSTKPLLLLQSYIMPAKPMDAMTVSVQSLEIHQEVSKICFSPENQEQQWKKFFNGAHQALYYSDLVNDLKWTGCNNSRLKSNWTQKYATKKQALVHFLFMDFEENANPNNLIRVFTRTGTGKLVNDISTKVSSMAFLDAQKNEAAV